MYGDEKGLKVSYEEYLNMQFRIGEIISCEEVKNSNKLLKCKVKTGTDTLQIISGIKGCYEPRELVGKKVTVLANLKPITMAGLTSEGMILLAEDKNGNLSFIVPEKEVEVGAEVC